MYRRYDVKGASKVGEGSTLTVRIDLGRDSSYESITVATQLEGYLCEEAFRPLDLPLNPSGLDLMFCTDMLTVERVMVARVKAAKMLADKLIPAILDIMAAKDTRNGYRNECK